VRTVRLVCLALLVLLTAACDGAGAPSARAAAGAPAATEEVRALVEQYGRGSGDKDEAGSAFYDLGPRAAPALLEIARDPATDEYALESIMFIASMYVREPEIFDALRTRAQALPDAAERDMRVRLIDGMRNAPGLPYPR
jgi:hypothetical protein